MWKHVVCMPTMVYPKHSKTLLYSTSHENPQNSLSSQSTGEKPIFFKCNYHDYLTRRRLVDLKKIVNIYRDPQLT